VIGIISPHLYIETDEKFLHLSEALARFVDFYSSWLRTAPSAVILLRLQNADLATTARPLATFGTDRLDPMVGLQPLLFSPSLECFKLLR